MTLTAGLLSQVSVSQNAASLSSAVATSGTGPYTYQWYRSTTTGFSPGAGNLIAGATALTLVDSGLIPNTQYFYKVVATDSASPTPATATSAQLSVATSVPSLEMNSVSMSTIVGMIDMRMSLGTVSAQIDVSQTTSLYAGAAVKIVDSAGGVPKIVGCSANSDEVLGFLAYNIKDVAFSAGMMCEIAMAGNFMYLYATGAIARGVQVSLDLSTNGGVRASSGNTGDDIVGWAFDKATAAGALIRVFVKTPSFAKV